MDHLNFKRHIPALDGVRGIAILLVLFHHFLALHSKATPIERYIVHFSELGWCGVDLFFCLSGFLITGILFDTKSKSDYLSTFYLRRSLRIFPLYYLSLFAILVLTPALVQESSTLENTVNHQWWFWTYLTNVLLCLPDNGIGLTATHFWSLAVEEQFYIMWPFVIGFLSTRTIVRVSVFLVATAFALRFSAIYFEWDKSIPYTLTFSRMDALVLGGLVAIGVRHQRSQDFIRQRGPAIVAGALLAFITVVILEGSFRRGSYMMTAGFSCLAILFSTTIGLVAINKYGLVNKTLSSPILTFFGKYSYAMYVVHPFLLFPQFLDESSGTEIYFGFTGIPKMVAHSIVTMILTIIAAKLSWELFEKRILKLKSRFEYSSSKSQSAT